MITFLAFFDEFWLHYHYYQRLDTKCELNSSRGAKRCALGLCSKPNFKAGQNWYFLAIFGFFWDWECYQIDENIFQTSYFSENHQRKYKMLMYHWFNSNFLSWNGWIFVFWKLIGEVRCPDFFDFGLKWSHMGWRNLG